MDMLSSHYKQSNTLRNPVRVLISCPHDSANFGKNIALVGPPFRLSYYKTSAPFSSGMQRGHLRNMNIQSDVTKIWPGGPNERGSNQKTTLRYCRLHANDANWRQCRQSDNSFIKLSVTRALFIIIIAILFLYVESANNSPLKNNRGFTTRMITPGRSRLHRSLSVLSLMDALSLVARREKKRPSVRVAPYTVRGSHASFLEHRTVTKSNVDHPKTSEVAYPSEDIRESHTLTVSNEKNMRVQVAKRNQAADVQDVENENLNRSSFDTTANKNANVSHQEPQSNEAKRQEGGNSAPPWHINAEGERGFQQAFNSKLDAGKSREPESATMDPTLMESWDEALPSYDGAKETTMRLKNEEAQLLKIYSRLTTAERSFFNALLQRLSLLLPDVMDTDYSGFPFGIQILSDPQKILRGMPVVGSTLFPAGLHSGCAQAEPKCISLYIIYTPAYGGPAKKMQIPLWILSSWSPKSETSPPNLQSTSYASFWSRYWKNTREQVTFDLVQLSKYSSLLPPPPQKQYSVAEGLGPIVRKIVNTDSPSEEFLSGRAFRQYILHGNLNLHSTVLSLWSVVIYRSTNRPPYVFWDSLRRERAVDFALRKPLTEIIKNTTFSSLTSICSHLAAHYFDVTPLLENFAFRSGSDVQCPPEVVGESFCQVGPQLPVMLRMSDAFKEAPIQHRLWTLLALRVFVNSRSAAPHGLIPFTTPRWTRAITGDDDATYIFLSSNFARGALQNLAQKKLCGAKHSAKPLIPERSSGADSFGVDESSTMINNSEVCPKQHIPLNGIVDINDSSIKIAFPTYKLPPDCPLKPISLSNTYLPSKIFPPLNLFASSYFNRGTQRSYAILIKKYCSAASDAQGICHFPCLPRNWRSACQAGRPATQPFSEDKETIQLYEDLSLPIAAFCDLMNPLVANSRWIQRECAISGFAHVKPLKERLEILGCETIVGTGDFASCLNIIEKDLLYSIVPSHTDSGRFGDAAPGEIKKFLPLSDMMLIFGTEATDPILMFRHYMDTLNVTLEDPDVEQSKGCRFNCTRPKGDLNILVQAAKTYCGMPLAVNLTDKIILKGHLLFQHFDFCFRSAYTYALLRSLGITSKGPPVYFHGGSETSQEFDYGWEAGSILHTVLEKSFIEDLFYLKSDYWRSTLRHQVCANRS